ncbi:unnamed protein product, partial [Ixodes hexagonus]
MLVNSIARQLPGGSTVKARVFPSGKMAELPATELRKAISGILDGADLDVLSSKKIRKQLEQKYGIDFSDRKKEIDGMVMELIAEQTPVKPGPKEENGDAGGSSSAGSSHDDNDVSLNPRLGNGLFS